MHHAVAVLAASLLAQASARVSHAMLNCGHQPLCVIYVAARTGTESGRVVAAARARVAATRGRETGGARLVRCWWVQTGRPARNQRQPARALQQAGSRQHHARAIAEG